MFPALKVDDVSKWRLAHILAPEATAAVASAGSLGQRTPIRACPPLDRNARKHGEPRLTARNTDACSLSQRTRMAVGHGVGCRDDHRSPGDGYQGDHRQPGMTTGATISAQDSGQGPRTKDQSQGAKCQGPRGQGQGPRTRARGAKCLGPWAQGPAAQDFGQSMPGDLWNGMPLATQSSARSRTRGANVSQAVGPSQPSVAMAASRGRSM